MSGKTALIVDDSNLARMMTRKIFVTHFNDWTLLDAKDGNEALEKMKEITVHLALIDFNMPGMNGLELAEKIREINQDVPIVLVTANIQERMSQRAEAMGIGFIKKPIDQVKISEILASGKIES